jgi:hypothetical protein
MAIGIVSPVGQTFDATITRDRLIEMAHNAIGVLEPGQSLDAEQLQDGIDLLGLIVRETDAAGKWLWTIEAATHLTLAASTFRYDANNGLATNIAELLTVFYRDAQGKDSQVTPITSEQYESLSDKMAPGVPTLAYLTEHRDLAHRELFLDPMVSAVTTGAQVLGDDNNSYKCIYPHLASLTNRPVTGANARMVWELGGLIPSTWISGASYVSTEQLRMTYRRPIFDFDKADDIPDFPISWPRTILYKLAFDLGDIYGIPIDERKVMVDKAKGAFSDVFPSTRAKSKNIHSKVKFF